MGLAQRGGDPVGVFRLDPATRQADLAGGALATAIGLRPTLWVAAAGGLTGILWLLRSPVLRLKTLPQAPPDAGGPSQ